MDIRTKIENAMRAAADDWFRRACREPFLKYYLFYKESPTGQDGPLFWTPIIDTEPPNDAWKIACAVSTAWTTDQVVMKGSEILRKLPILNIDHPSA